eukprot:14855997-Alexandrium_andersonii.AAC.1
MRGQARTFVAGGEKRQLAATTALGSRPLRAKLVARIRPAAVESCTGLHVHASCVWRVRGRARAP